VHFPDQTPSRRQPKLELDIGLIAGQARDGLAQRLQGHRGPRELAADVALGHLPPQVGDQPAVASQIVACELGVRELEGCRGVSQLEPRKAEIVETQCPRPARQRDRSAKAPDRGQTAAVDPPVEVDPRGDRSNGDVIGAEVEIELLIAGSLAPGDTAVHLAKTVGHLKAG